MDLSNSTLASLGKEFGSLISGLCPLTQERKAESWSEIEKRINQVFNFFDTGTLPVASEEGVTVQLYKCIDIKRIEKEIPDKKDKEKTKKIIITKTSFRGFPEDFDSCEQIDKLAKSNVASKLRSAYSRGDTFDVSKYVDFFAPADLSAPDYLRDWDGRYFCAHCRSMLKKPVRRGGRLLYISNPNGYKLPCYGYHGFKSGFDDTHLINWTESHDSKDIEYDVIPGYEPPFRHIHYLYGHPHTHYLANGWLPDMGWMQRTIVNGKGYGAMVKPIESYLASAVIENFCSKYRKRVRHPGTGCFPFDSILVNSRDEEEFDMSNVSMWNLSGMVALQVGFSLIPKEKSIVALPLENMIEWGLKLAKIWNSIPDEMQADLLLGGDVMVSPKLFATYKKRYPEFHESVGFSRFGDIEEREFISGLP